jgi:hypothetical protein
MQDNYFSYPQQNIQKSSLINIVSIAAALSLMVLPVGTLRRRAWAVPAQSIAKWKKKAEGTKWPPGPSIPKGDSLFFTDLPLPGLTQPLE